MAATDLIPLTLNVYHDGRLIVRQECFMERADWYAFQRDGVAFRNVQGKMAASKASSTPEGRATLLIYSER
jgi:hypothetical protein